jgi:outer membrane protein OmpA-like peptidoglycan-associated protein
VLIFPLLVIFLSIVFVMPIWAGELAFPGSESEIVEAMQFRDGLFTIDGQAYESKDGRVYKIINGNHYRMRGLRVLADTDIVPKTGALILFDFGTTDIRPESLPLLEEYAKAFAGNLSQARFMICGHTDSSGDRAYNQQLSESRARSVAAYLAEHHGIDADRFDIVGYGEDRPIADNHSSGGRLKNRRVEFIRID